MWTVSLIFLIPIIFIIPLVWFLTWQTGKNLTGMRLENHRSQADRSYRLMGPVWLLMLLLMGQHIINAHPVSREHRAFWLGFIAASDLFLWAFMIQYLIVEMRRLREKHQQQAQAKMNVLDNQLDGALPKVRALLVAVLRIRAVQLYREQTGASIEASLAAIEQIESHAKFSGSASD